MDPAGRLLATRLSPPVQRQPLLARERLSKLLDGGAGSALITVVAPAGYGKSSLLAQHFRALAAQSRCVAWVSLEPADDDTARFIELLIEGIRRQRPGFGEGVLARLRGGPGPEPEALMANLLNAMAAMDEPCVVFIDDFHVVSDAGLVAAMNTALLHCPAGLQWILAARRLPPGLALARLRARGALLSVTAPDLRFDNEESGRYLGEYSGLALTAGQARRLAERTEGWIAGLQLACLSLRRVEAPGAWIEGLSGQYSEIASFMAEEVLRAQSPALREFLLRCGVLGRLHRDLCTAVTGLADCASLLEQAVAAQLFVFGLDERGDWYRFHHLFAEFLQRQLQLSEPALVPQLHARASAWFQARGEPLEAIAHAEAAGDPERAASLLEGLSEQLFASGRVTTLETLAGRLPAAVLSGHPRLLLDLAWQRILRWDFSASAEVLDQVADALAAPAPRAPAEQRYLEGKLAHRRMMLAFISDDLRDTARRCHGWLDAGYRSDPAMHMLTSVNIILHAARRHAFQADQTEALAAAMHDICVAHDVRYGRVYHDCLVGITFASRGELVQARSRFASGRALASALQGGHSALAAMPGLLLADIAWEANAIDEARDLVEAHLHTATGAGIVDQLVAGYLTQARSLARAGDGAAALQALASAERDALRFGFTRLLEAAAAERIRLCLRSGDTSAARAVGQGRGLGTSAAGLQPGDGDAVTHIRAMAWARLAAQRGDGAGALRLLERWWGFLADGGWARPLAATTALLAVTAAREGEQATAQRYLLQALAQAPVAACQRSFLDEGPALQALLAAVPDGHCEGLARLRAAASREPAGPGAESLPAPGGEPLLKTREREILALAAEERSNREIAARLALSENTVKWHWQQIFARLGVRRRGMAVRRARELGLLH